MLRRVSTTASIHLSKRSNCIALASSKNFTSSSAMSEMNKYSKHITQPKSQGASQAMLYATGLTEEDMSKAQVGIGTVWFESNPCNQHLLGLGQQVKKGLVKEGLVGYQFNTVGVSDGISMGTPGMRYSLQSRDLIADSIETIAGGQWYDGLVVVPGCDKNMPGVLMALGRLNRPGIMVYGGTIAAGKCGGQPIDIISAFQSYGEYLQKGKTEEADKERRDIVRHACPGSGACGGMYTANTMASAAEALGMTLPGSSSFPAESDSKIQECLEAGKAVKNLLEKDIKPRDIMTRIAFENAMTLIMILGGSTNAVLHLIAIAKSVDIKLTIDDFQAVSERTPFIADLKPSGKYVMEDLSAIGGIPSVLKMLLENDMIDGSQMTVTGKTLAQNLENVPHLKAGQDIIRPLHNPIKASGHIRILRGNLAPGGSVSKITGKEGLVFKGKAMPYDTEDDFIEALERGEIKKGEKSVVIIRYVGPKGGPGMPEMLKPSSAIIGAGLAQDVALLTDGRFSGGSHGFLIGHIVPEAQEGGPIGLVEKGDEIVIDAEKNSIDMLVSDEEIAKRKAKWVNPPLKVSSGTLYKYARLVRNASEGCITDM